MSLYEKTYVILTIITFMMALSCLTHLVGRLPSDLAFCWHL